MAYELPAGASLNTSLGGQYSMYNGGTPTPSMKYVPQTDPTGSAIVPTGSSAQRDILPKLGAIRYNTSLNYFEGWDGANWTPLANMGVDSGTVGVGVPELNTFNGDGVTTVFTLSVPVTSERAIIVAVSGVYQEIDSYTLVGRQLTFSEAPPVGTSNIQVLIYSGSNSQYIAYTPAGTSAVITTVQAKLRESVSVLDFGAVGDGVTDDTAAIQAAIDATPQRGVLVFPQASNPAGGYRITNTLNFINKAGCTIDFNNQIINAAGFTGAAKAAIFFSGMSEAVITNAFVLGNTISVNRGVFFHADATHTSIHMKVGKLRVAGCQIGIQVGVATYQVSDSYMEELYGTDGVVGVYLTGENTLAMAYGSVKAYSNTTRGVHIEQGGGSIAALGAADSGVDIWFGSTSGNENSKLQRWEIVSGYSEEGVVGEVFIRTAATIDTNPFTEQIVFHGFRCTPFSTTNVTDFIQWNLNGDLVFKNCSISHGQQYPRVSIDPNTSYRNATVRFDDCVINAAAIIGVPQILMDYITTTDKQRVIINSATVNAMSWWNNGGFAANGLVSRGVYHDKIREFETNLLSAPPLVGSWNFLDAGNKNQTAKNLVLGGPSLAVSALLQQRDLSFDDGLCGVFQNGGNTLKTISSTNAAFSASSWTFGAIVRTLENNTDPVDGLTLGGVLGIRIGISVSAGVGIATCRVGGFSASVAVANPYDAHSIIAVYESAVAISIYATNLRTGAVVSAINTTAIPAFGTLTWVNGISLVTQLSIKGHIFCSKSVYTEDQAKSIMSAATRLTDSWRL